MKNTTEGINIRANDGWVNWKTIVGITDAEQKKEKMKRNESLRDLWDNIKCTDIHVPEGEEREKRTENIFEDIIAENFSTLENETDIQVQEVQRAPSRSQRGTYEDTLSLKWQNLKGKKY